MENNDPIKQVICIRKDLKMRRGKEISQGSHAAMAFLTRKLTKYFGQADQKSAMFCCILTEVQQKWIEGSFLKVCLQVNSDEELLAVRQKAEELGLETQLITDSGKTEFNGIPTRTALAIGPDYSSKIDPITGHLKLY